VLLTYKEFSPTGRQTHRLFVTANSMNNDDTTHFSPVADFYPVLMDFGPQSFSEGVDSDRLFAPPPDGVANPLLPRGFSPDQFRQNEKFQWIPLQTPPSSALPAARSLSAGLSDDDPRA
jgi:hypothetical protein